MIRASNFEVEGIFFIVPDQLIMDWPALSLDAFPDSCGPGSGIGNLVVPETVFGLRITPACFIHDFCWQVADASWADFHQANSIFLHNLLAIIKARSANMLMQAIRNYRAITYYNAVDLVGQNIFWAEKEEQGYDVSGQ